ncbi:MAG: DNA polymerase I, partial [Oligoflexales bacterium]|nr:DNA polymerase I [Oligoflexales bacterium]
MVKKRLFIVDVMAMAFRNYHAFGVQGLKNSNNLPTSATFGSTKFLLKLIQDEKPDYLVFATDSDKKTFRHEIFREYKANRSEMPEDLSAQIPYLFRILETISNPTLKMPGLEADDLIGSLVTKFKSDSLHCYIVSGDKDFMQLIDDDVSLYVPRKGGEISIVGKDGVFEKFGCSPSKVTEILALTGDPSDNVPGVPGIGEKGACTLIQKYGGLDGIYANIDKITNKKQQSALIENKDIAYLSKKLVTIKTDADVPSSLEEFRCDRERIISSKKLLSLMEELEFQSLSKMLRENILQKTALESEEYEKTGFQNSSDQENE